MLVGSFRFVTARLIPQITRCKQALLFATVILAGCGGSGAARSNTQWQTVAAAGLTFQAPAGWKVEHAKSRVSATHGSELVQVSTFPLTKRYDKKLFVPVATELRTRMEEIARQTGGKLGAGSSVTADGVRSHVYDVTVGSQVDEFTFVISRQPEYLLLGPPPSSGAQAFCNH